MLKEAVVGVRTTVSILPNMPTCKDRPVRAEMSPVHVEQPELPNTGQPQRIADANRHRRGAVQRYACFGGRLAGHQQQRFRRGFTPSGDPGGSAQ